MVNTPVAHKALALPQTVTRPLKNPRLRQNLRLTVESLHRLEAAPALKRLNRRFYLSKDIRKYRGSSEPHYRALGPKEPRFRASRAILDTRSSNAKTLSLWAGVMSDGIPRPNRLGFTLSGNPS